MAGSKDVYYYRKKECRSVSLHGSKNPSLLRDDVTNFVHTIVCWKQDNACVLCVIKPELLKYCMIQCSTTYQNVKPIADEEWDQIVLTNFEKHPRCPQYPSEFKIQYHNLLNNHRSIKAAHPDG